MIALASLVAALLSVAITVWAMFRSSWQDHAEFLKTDPVERAKRIAELRGGSFGKLYPMLLERGLTILDHRFGAPFSAQALNVCTLLALGYAYVFFFVAYVMGAPGGLGEGVMWAPPVDETSISIKLLIAVFSILVPPLAFLLARWSGRFPVNWERRFKLGICRRLGSTSLSFEVYYRLLSAGIVGIIFFFFGSRSETLAAVIVFLSFYGLIASTSWIGHHLATVFSLSWLQSPLVTIVGALIAGALAAVPKSAAILGALLGALAVVGIGVAASAAATSGFTATVAFLLVIATASGLDTNSSRGGAGIFGIVAAVIALAVAVGISISVLAKRRLGLCGLFAGPIGLLVGLAAVAALFGSGKQFSDEVIFAWITLLLALPIINGIWDFGSWLISRSLGKHLLGKLKGKYGSISQGWTIFWHIAADLVIAIGFLLSLAWFLGLAFESYHNIGVWWHSAEQGPLPQLIQDIKNAAAEPFSKGLWLTAMLLSTLIPTLLHGAMAIAGALSLFTPVTAVRKSLAEDLEALDHLDEKTQALVLQRAGRHIANGRPGIWFLAVFLLLGLVALLSISLTYLHAGGFADWVKDAALAGVAFSDLLFDRP